MGNQNNFILIFIMAIGLVAGYVYYTNVYVEVFVAEPLSSKTENLKELENITLDFPEAEIARIGALRIFGENPVKPGPIGKINIFAPF